MLTLDIHSSIGDPHNQTTSLKPVRQPLRLYSKEVKPHCKTRPLLYCSQLVVSRGVATIDRIYCVIRPPLYCSQLVVSRGVATIDRFHCVIRPPLYCSQLVGSLGVATIDGFYCVIRPLRYCGQAGCVSRGGHYRQVSLCNQATSLLQPAGCVSRSGYYRQVSCYAPMLRVSCSYAPQK